MAMKSTHSESQKIFPRFTGPISSSLVMFKSYQISRNISRRMSGMLSQTITGRMRIKSCGGAWWSKLTRRLDMKHSEFANSPAYEECEWAALVSATSPALVVLCAVVLCRSFILRERRFIAMYFVNAIKFIILSMYNREAVILIGKINIGNCLFTCHYTILQCQ